MILITHLIFAVVLFFIINWIGKHSISVGYIEITLFSQNEDAPALNFLIRVLSPLVYLIIISSFLYSVKLDELVGNIYLVNVYYVLFRLSINLLKGRLLLLNWSNQILYGLSIISLSVILYENLIKDKKNILPDFSSMANELWIIILVFIYQLINNLNLPSLKAEIRKEKYIRQNYVSFNRKFGSIIKRETKNKALEIVVYAILIYEDFNRPRIYRWIEYFVFTVFPKTQRTLGVMQYKTDKFISDVDSVKLGTRKIVNFYKNLIRKNNFEKFDHKDQILSLIIEHYNGGYKYEREVSAIYELIEGSFYKDNLDVLLPAKGRGIDTHTDT